jgi:thiamine biosynthesis lipoprotein
MLDFGATAQAMAADRIAHAVTARLGCGVLVSLGGDVAVAGPPPPDGFPIGVGETWWESDPAETVALSSGGLATSGIGIRHWRLGAVPVHHIIDPANGLPAPAFWRAVSVAAATCVGANLAATAAMVKGNRALPWLEELGLPARLVSAEGDVVLVAGWPAPDAEGALVAAR